MTSSRGERPEHAALDIAARYVAAQFAQYGVQPKGDAGSYLHAVPLKTGRLVQDSPRFDIHRKGVSNRSYSWTNSQRRHR